MKIFFAVLMLAALTASTLALPMRSDAKAEELDLLRKALLQRLLDNNMEAKYASGPVVCYITPFQGCDYGSPSHTTSLSDCCSQYDHSYTDVNDPYRCRPCYKL